jgi:glycine hydroxymethyltransferase
METAGQALSLEVRLESLTYFSIVRLESLTYFSIVRLESLTYYSRDRLMAISLIEAYFQSHEPRTAAPGFLAYLANLECVRRVSPEVARSIVQEIADQRANIKMIASENFSSLATQCAMANLLTDKYAEGIPHHRFYAGCDNVDSIEDLANQRARELFGASHAYAQPHSGADANLVAFWAILRARVELSAMAQAVGAENTEALAPADWYKLNPAQWQSVRQSLGNQRLLGMDLASGGHLTHGYRLNVSGKMFEAHGYTVDRTTFLLDYDAIERQALEVKPLILLAGFSAYSRNINYARMRAIADQVGAVFMVDMAHFAGLVAGKVLQGDFNPIPHAHVVTTTTHKTLRGPRGGLVLCADEFKSDVDRGCPLVLGGPLPHVMAAKTVAFTEALRPEFSVYAHQIVANARALGEAFMREGLQVLTGGTDNHLLVLDVARTHGITGRQAEDAIRRCGVTLNRNPIPFDANGPWYTSGLRFGAAAVTTLGMGTPEMNEIASVVALVLKNIKPATTKSGALDKTKYTLAESTRDQAHSRIDNLLKSYPVYPEIDLPFLIENLGMKSS